MRAGAHRVPQVVSGPPGHLALVEFRLQACCLLCREHIVKVLIVFMDGPAEHGYVV